VQRLLAARFWQDRLALAGDAAHVLSPIGGQGMNLGWLDAWALGAALHRVLRQGARPAAELGDYADRRRASAVRAIRRAELNMRMGVGGWWNPLRDGLVKVALRSPAQGLLARLFTMRGL
jgi:2-polyprenyl-6-methoxyphenol hydroxylase-like FAD-dependent oxidoreductase